MEAIWALWGVSWFAPFVYASMDLTKGSERDPDRPWPLAGFVDGTMGAFQLPKFTLLPHLAADLN